MRDEAVITQVSQKCRIIISTMKKQTLHKVWHYVRFIKPWYLLVLALLLAITCIFALRANNSHMGKLRSAVYSADQSNGDVQGTLNNLQAYVTSHMNTDLTGGNTGVYPPIQLQYTYERLEEQAGQGGNGDLYTQAQAYCQKQDAIDFSGHNRVPCIEQFVQSHGVKPVQLPASLYEFAFISPRWSPDLAGWTMFAAIGTFLLAVGVFFTDRWFRNSL